MKKTIVGGLFVGAALLSGLSTGTAHADSFTGSKGDRNVRAYFADTGSQLNDPAQMANSICQLRQKGMSEGKVISSMNPTSSTIGAYTVIVQAAEWHFCPSYYNAG